MRNILFVLILFSSARVFAQIDEPLPRLTKPEFPEGEAAMFKFIAYNIEYPAEARAKDIQGVVVVSFVVNEEGKISDIAIIRDIGGGCGEEAVRVVKLMPDWKPGTTATGPAKTSYTLPFRFRLEGGKKEKKKKKKVQNSDTPLGN